MNRQHFINLPTLHVVGDSISIHYGPQLQVLLAGVMTYSRKAALDGSLAETGDANGGDSTQVLAYLKTLQADQHFDYLLINCGLHDIKRDRATKRLQVPLEQYVANLRDSVSIAARLAGQLIWVRTTPVIDERHNRLNPACQRFAADVEAYNATADRIMHAYAIPTIDLFTFTRNLGIDVYVDHVHFVERARAQQAAFIAGHLYPLAAAGAQ